MIVYHGSTLVIERPSVAYTKRFLDFGAGFYVTADKNTNHQICLINQRLIDKDLKFCMVYEVE